MAKTCTFCKETKPEDAFGTWRGKLFTQCRKCRNRPTDAKKKASKKWYEKKGAAYIRAWRKKQHPDYDREIRLKVAYGMSQADYLGRVAAQEGRCAICNAAPDKLYVDHDHVTGDVRGLLCLKCNSGLGMFCDSVTSLVAAARYIERFGVK